MVPFNSRPTTPEHSAEAVCQVKWRFGLHARPSSAVAKLAAGFSSTIAVQMLESGVQVSAKGVIGLMMLAAEPGALLIVSATGRDATDAVEAMRDLFERSFDMHEWSVPNAIGVSVNTVTGATYRTR